MLTRAGTPCLRQALAGRPVFHTNGLELAVPQLEGQQSRVLVALVTI
ncbi:MAG: hypothetical protein NTZ40_11860 [Cyanobacteria bacterium]|nr:hypothetical protein [Cyanobacteriota bacterium]